jgi:translation initiation factor 2B subunit (eIF-2B alpha/beta/delta family)
MAKNFRKPFYVFCQTFKFSEESQIDSFIVNKGSDKSVTDETCDTASTGISMRYDLTPMKNISLVSMILV